MRLLQKRKRKDREEERRGEKTSQDKTRRPNMRISIFRGCTEEEPSEGNKRTSHRHKGKPEHVLSKEKSISRGSVNWSKCC